MFFVERNKEGGQEGRASSDHLILPFPRRIPFALRSSFARESETRRQKRSGLFSSDGNFEQSGKHKLEPNISHDVFENLCNIQSISRLEDQIDTLFPELLLDGATCSWHGSARNAI